MHNNLHPSIILEVGVVELKIIRDVVWRHKVDDVGTSTIRRRVGCHSALESLKGDVGAGSLTRQFRCQCPQHHEWSFHSLCPLGVFATHSHWCPTDTLTVPRTGIPFSVLRRPSSCKPRYARGLGTSHGFREAFVWRRFQTLLHLKHLSESRSLSFPS